LLASLYKIIKFNARKLAQPRIKVVHNRPLIFPLLIPARSFLSSLTCYRSYADPVVGFEDQSSNGSTPPADSQASIPNGKHVVKKN